MLRRVFQPLANLHHQRQFYGLLVLLAPLMFSLHWMAVRFPICFPDYVDATVYEVEPDKLAVVFESYGPRGGGSNNSQWRAWLLDMEAETFTPVACPKELGATWPKRLGKDSRGNLIFEKSHVSWNARTGETCRIDLLPNDPVTINSRYLASICYDELVNPVFTWCDLLEPNHPRHSAPIMDIGGGIVPIIGTDSFYFVLPAEAQDWLANSLDNGMSMMGMAGESSDEVPATDYFEEWTNDDGSAWYELPPVVVNPSAPIPRATAVLMKLTDHGPKEVTRWPVFSSDSFAITAGPGYIVSQTLEAQFLETRDATTGEIVARIPIPKSALATGVDPRLESFTTVGGISYFYDTGSCRAFDSKTGTPLSSIPPLGRVVLSSPGKFKDEYLTWLIKNYPKDWPGEIQLRSAESHDVLATWVPPDRNVWVSSQPEDRVHFSQDGKNVLFYTGDLRVLVVDKVTGKLERHIQPRFWLPYLAVVLGLLTLLWLVCWIRMSVRSGLSLWVDELILTTIVMTFLYWRINLSGNPFNEGRVAWVCVGSMAIAVMTLIINQTLFRKVRLLYRCAPIIILTVAAVFAQWKWMSRPFPGDLIVEVLLVLLLVAGSIAVHLLFFRKRHDAHHEVKASQRGFSLGELFGWTGLVALMLAPLKLYSLDRWIGGLSWDSSVRGLGGVIVIAAVTLAAYFLTAKRSYLVCRLLGGIPLVILLAVTAAYRLDYLDLNSHLVSIIPTDIAAAACEGLLVVALGSMLIALPIGMRNDM